MLRKLIWCVALAFPLFVIQADHALSAAGKTCHGGSHNGFGCTSVADCPNACVGGALPGNSCTFNTDCPSACVGGSHAFFRCSSGIDCPGGSCSNIGQCSNIGTCS